MIDIEKKIMKEFEKVFSRHVRGKTWRVVIYTGVNNASMKGKQERMTTEGLLVEAKKISEWVIPKEEEPV